MVWLCTFLPFCPKIDSLAIRRQIKALLAHLVPFWWLVGGCGAQAVSCKTSIYSMISKVKGKLWRREGYMNYNFQSRRQIMMTRGVYCPKTTKFGPKLAYLVNLGQAMQAYLVPCWWVSWWLRRAGCISQDTYLLYVFIQHMARSPSTNFHHVHMWRLRKSKQCEKLDYKK